MSYVRLKFVDFIGIMLMSAALIGVFVSDLSYRQLRDLALLGSCRVN